MTDESSSVPTSKTRRLASWLVFPGLMTLGLLAVYQLLEAGVRPSLATLAVLLPASLLIAVLERLLPYRRRWNHEDGDVKTDLVHMLIAQIAIPNLAKPVSTALLLAVTAWAAELFQGRAWPHGWPLLAQLFLMLLIAEFGRYWVHRAAHTFPVLWRFHAVHHSPSRLYWLNAGRFHPIEKIFFLLPETVPFIVLGTNVECLSLYFVFNGIHGLLQHSNIDVKAGPLNRIFSLTELHRWHHSKRIEESNQNYGNNLIVWDLVFGTYYLPKDREVGPIGLLNPDYPKGYGGQLAAPFRKGDVSKPEGWRAEP